MTRLATIPKKKICCTNYANNDVRELAYLRSQMCNVRGFIVVTQTIGTPGGPDVFNVGLAIPLPKLFCFEALGEVCSRGCTASAGFRSRESFTVKSNRANEKARGEYILINEAFRQQRQKGI